MRIGANYLGASRCEFTVWGPFLKKPRVKVLRDGAEPVYLGLVMDGAGYWRTTAEGVGPGSLYLIDLDGRAERADPASHHQPFGVEGPSSIVDHASFAWTDNEWKGTPLSEAVIYEIHTGAFTPEGTFEAIIPRLDEIRGSGFNVIELMPVAQFPGRRNWGYDGVFHYAPQESYGGPEGLKRLINECHMRGLSVLLDAVYNHFGPEGNYMADFGPYFSERCATPWGMALNFDGPCSDEVRDYFIENALYWRREFHIDGLRLDAVHAIYDSSARPFLKELKEKASGAAGDAPFHIIAESDSNDPVVFRSPRLFGWGLDAVWCDDFQHSLFSLLTGEGSGYYADFGRASHLVKALKEGFVYTGQYSAYRKRSFGAPAGGPANDHFIAFSQNHDQIGNRMLGERLSALVPFEALKLSAGAVILSPFVPLVFMGEEYGEDAPFLYFIDHADRSLAAATAAGRKEEFREFGWLGEPPDPASPETFARSKLRWEDRSLGRHRVLLDLYRELIKLRRSNAALSSTDPAGVEASCMEDEKVVFLLRTKDGISAFSVFNFGARDADISITLPEGIWVKALDSSEERWKGPGTGLPEVLGSREKAAVRARSFAVYLIS